MYCLWVKGCSDFKKKFLARSKLKVIADIFEILLLSIMYLLMTCLLFRLYEKTTISKWCMCSDLELRFCAWTILFSPLSYLTCTKPIECILNKGLQWSWTISKSKVTVKAKFSNMLLVSFIRAGGLLYTRKTIPTEIGSMWTCYCYIIFFGEFSLSTVFLWLIHILDFLFCKVNASLS